MKRLALFVWLALLVALSIGAPVRVQTNNNSGSGVSSIVVTLGANPTNGDVLVAVIGDSATTGNVSSVTSSGATWQRATQQAFGTVPYYETEIWYAYNVTGASAATVTVNFSASTAGGVTVCEYSGLGTGNPLDQTANSSGNSAAAVTGTTATTTAASEVWVGGLCTGSASSSPLNSFTIVANPSNGTYSTYLEYMASATGTANSGATITSAHWSGCIATFKNPNAGVHHLGLLGVGS